MDTDKLLSDWDRVTASALRPRSAPRPAGVPGTGVALRLAGGAVMVTLLVGALAWVAPRPGGSQAGGVAASLGASPEVSQDVCLVTRPNGAHTDAWPASPLDHGDGGLFTVLWPDGVVAVPPDGVDTDGVLWMKFVVQREGAAVGPLRIGGRRVGGAAGDPLDTVRATIPDGYGESGVQAAAIGFPRAGCWEVIAVAGEAQLRFVTRVRPMRPDDLIGQPAPPIRGVGLDGTPVTVELGGDRSALVDFTAGWCPPCVEEQQSLADGRPMLEAAGIDLITVLVRGTAEDDARFVADHDITGTVVRDPDGNVLDAYAGFGLPMSVLADGDGIIRRLLLGPLTADEQGLGISVLYADASPAAP